MTTMIQFAHIQSSQNASATDDLGIPGPQFESIDSGLLFAVIGGKGNGNGGDNLLTRWGKNMQTGGEYAMAAGAVGTAVPVLGETGIPEGVAAGGGAAWLVGKGAQALGGLFH